MNPFTNGHAYLLKLNYTKPPKNKYVICINDDEQKPLFIFIKLFHIL